MTIFLVRDDDPNATTDPARLARAYAPLLDAGIPVSFSVIPRVRLDTRAPDGTRERFLDEGSPDCAEERPLTRETPIIQWLRAHEGEVDVFCHGLSHQRIRGNTEFGSLTRSEATSRIDLAQSIFVRSLGRAPRAFVPPWDALSKGALAAANDAFALVSTGWVSRAHLPVSAWGAHVVERALRREALPVRRSWVVRHRGGKIAGDTRPEDVPHLVDAMAERADVAVIVLHHWMFWDHGSDHPVVRALAKTLAAKRTATVAGVIQHLATTAEGATAAA
jgi:hypothetical protein